MRSCRIQVSPGAAVFFPALFFWDSTGWFSALIPAAAVHELGHLAAVKLCRGTVTGLRLDLTGLCMEVTPIAEPVRQALCAAAGPAAGLLLWLAAAGSGRAYWHMCGEISLLLSLFNLLPALPLDGGRILLAAAGSPALLRWCGLASGVLCGFLALRFSAWGLGIPALFLLTSAVKPEWTGEFPRPAVPAGRSAPGIRPGHGRNRSGSARGKSAGI